MNREEDRVGEGEDGASKWFDLEMKAAQVFSPASPIDEKALFAGRHDQRRRVLDALFQRGQSVILFGERGVGKTSLANVLHQFLRELEKDARILAPKVSCTSDDSFATLWRRIFSEIHVTEAAKTIGFSTSQTTLRASATVADSLPSELVPDTVSKTLRYLSDQGVKVVAIFDEFDRLESDEARRLFADTIKMLSDYPTIAKIVLVGVADSIDQLQMGHPSVERALVQVPMPRMSQDELLEIVQNGIKALNLQMPDPIRVKIVELSKGLPHYTHLLAMNTIRAAIAEQVFDVREAHFASGIKASLDSCQQSIKAAYHKAIMTPRKESLFPQVLLACALAETDELGFFAPSDVREPLSTIMHKAYDIPAFARHLNSFCDKGRGPILQQIGESRRHRFRFVNPLMQPYVVLRGYDEKLI